MAFLSYAAGHGPLPLNEVGLNDHQLRSSEYTTRIPWSVCPTSKEALVKRCCFTLLQLSKWAGRLYAT